MLYKGKFKSKIVVITGGSSGIGLAVAKEFAKSGANLALIGRNQDKLNEAKKLLTDLSTGVKIEIFSLDIVNKEDVEKTINKITGIFGGIDILINNAGYNVSGKFENISILEHESIMKTNYFGSYYMTKFALPDLKRSNYAHVAFVSSVAGYTGLIGYSAYSPSKFAMCGLAEALRMEFLKDNINVSLIYPPNTETPLLERLKKENMTKLPEINKLSQNAKLVSPEFVAKKLLKAMSKRQFAVYCNVESRLITVLKSISPFLYNKIVDYLAFK